MLHRVPQGRGGIDRREHVAPGTLDVRLQTLDQLLRLRVGVGRPRHVASRGIT